jgi:RNA polymerase sigma-70 factor (ECF subfamily)
MAEVYQACVHPLTRMVRVALFRGRGFGVMNRTVELENVVVETFARAFEPRARMAYDGIRPYEQFLLGIARNHLLELSRQRELATGLEPGGEDAMPLHAEDEPDAHQKLEDAEVEALLEAFQAELSPEDLRLYQLRFEEGLGQEAAAAKLAATRIQVRRRELALKKRLLSFFQNRGYLGHLEMRGWGFFNRKGA